MHRLMLKLSPANTLPKHVEKQKGSLAKTMALHVHHDFWYISQTFSAKHDKISQARFKRRILQVPNLMQMKKIYCFRSFTVDSAHVKCEV